MEVRVLIAQEGNAGINSSKVYQGRPCARHYGGDRSDLDMSHHGAHSSEPSWPCERETWLQGVERPTQMRIYWLT